MGGSAFLVQLPHARFPRLPTSQYETYKQLLLPRVHAFFQHAKVPVEAPEKTDHGDLDILALGPLSPDERGDLDFGALKQALGAEACILQRGNRTSNFAIPLSRLSGFPVIESAENRPPTGATLGREMDDSTDAYLQVDVHVCEDQNEFERITFFHSYGDMGMLLGLIAKGAGLQLGATGLKVSLHSRRFFHCF
jgi:hypothetical protein